MIFNHRFVNSISLQTCNQSLCDIISCMMHSKKNNRYIRRQQQIAKGSQSFDVGQNLSGNNGLQAIEINKLRAKCASLTRQVGQIKSRNSKLRKTLAAIVTTKCVKQSITHISDFVQTKYVNKSTRCVYSSMVAC